MTCYKAYISENTDLSNVDFKFSDVDLQGVDFRGKNFSRNVSFYNTDLRDSILSGLTFDNEPSFDSALLCHAVLDGSSLADADFDQANLEKASLKGGYFRGATFMEANLMEADLTDADLTGANLSGACLRGANLKGAIGIGTKEGEIAFAKSLLRTLETRKGFLDMERWHSYSEDSCRTTHCIAGWAFPNEAEPGQKASLLYPTLAQYFYASNEEAMEALCKVASGELSVFPD